MKVYLDELDHWCSSRRASLESLIFVATPCFVVLVGSSFSAVAVSFLVKSHSHRFLLESDRVRDLKSDAFLLYQTGHCEIVNSNQKKSTDFLFLTVKDFPSVYMQSLVWLRNTLSMRSVSNLLPNSLTYTVVVRLLFSQGPAMFACAASSKDILSFLIPLLKANWITTIQCVIYNFVVDPFVDSL